MRGIVYRLRRRRTASSLVAMGVAVSVALGSSAVATAKAPSGGHPPAKPPRAVAHATGHKIA